MEEVWKEIKGFSGIYQISNFGNIRSMERSIELHGYIKHQKEIIKKCFIGNHGYTIVALSYNSKQITKTVHRLVADAFIPNEHNKQQINHIDGNKQNNRVDNLEWLTPSDNQKHSYSTLKRKRTIGEKASKAKFSDNEMLEIKKILCSNLFSTYKVAKIYGVDPSTFWNVKNNKTWKHLTIGKEVKDGMD